MRRIDIHTHLLPKQLPDWKGKFGYGGFMQLEHTGPCCARMVRDDGRFFRDVQENLWDSDARLRDMLKTSVDKQVLSTVPFMFHYKICGEHCLDVAKFLNDHLAEVVQGRPDKFYGLGTIPMQDPDTAIGELHRVMKDLKLHGVQIASNVVDENLHDSKFFPFFEEAEKLGAAIFVHPWYMLGREKIQKYWLPWLVGMPAEVSRAICSFIFGGIFERLPNLRVAFAHGGGAFPFTLGRIQHGFTARPDLCAIDNEFAPSHYVGKFFVDSLVHDERSMRFIVDMFGADSICLGSDYPFPLGEDRPGEMVLGMDYDEAIKEKILWSSAMRWLGLDQEGNRKQDIGNRI